MDSIDQLLTRGVENIYPTKAALEQLLRGGKKLKLYQGFDPTGDKLHLGHMIGLRKLRQWQDAGHHVIFLIGDGTGQAGDPSGKTTAREKFHTREELRQNAVDYITQAKSIMRFAGENPVHILYNGDWLNKLGLVDILNIAENFSLQQLAERDLFQERMKRGESVNLREFLYPLLQGYDSVAMDIDLEIGGSDQTFNMLCGRTLVKNILHKEKFVLTTPLLVDASGKKIGKTEGNVIALTDTPADLFAKIMSLGDEIIVKGLEYLTDVPLSEIRSVENAIQAGENPLQCKKLLAFEVTKQLHTEGIAHDAQVAFEKRVQQKEQPHDIPIITLTKKEVESMPITEILMKLDVAQSIAEAKRLIQQGGVKINTRNISLPHQPLMHYATGNDIFIQVGKFKFRRIKVASESGQNNN